MGTAQRLWCLFVAGGLLVAAGCGKGETAGEPLATYTTEEAQTDPEYVVEQPDAIRIEVANHPEITRVAQLRPDGKITMPLLGDVSVTGLTPLEIDEKLTKLYSRYLKEVDITVTVTNFASKNVYLFREPGQARALPYTGRQDFLKTMARAGGPGEQAWTSRIRLIRATPEKAEIRLIDYDDVVRKGLLDEEHNPTIRDGDIIFIPMHPFFWFAWKVETIMRPINAAFQPVRMVDTWTDVFQND